MINSNFQDACKHIGVSKSAFKGCFSELKKRGLLFTPAKTAGDFIEKEYPARIAFIGPTAHDRNVLSTGPFAISKKFYLNAFLNLKSQLSEGELVVFMALKWVEYEKQGAALEKPYTIESKDDEIISVAQMFGVYDLTSPHVYKDFVWFDVKQEFKTKGFSATFQEEPTKEFWWWKGLCDFEEGFMPTIPADNPESLSLVPNWFQELPKRYFPRIVHYVLLELFLCLTVGLKVDGLKIKKFKLLEIMREIISKYDFPENHAEEVDGELLVKELCDYNGYIYPVDEQATFNYLKSLGVIKNKHGSSAVIFVGEFKFSANFLVPEDWEERYNKYVETGSILFSYLSVDEIVN